MKEIVKDYYDGMYYGDFSKLDKVFYSEAQLQGYFQGELMLINYKQWVEVLSQAESPASTNQPYEYELIKVDEIGDTATLKVSNTYAGLSFTDHLSLLKIEGHWKIVNKLFHHEPA